MLVDKMNIIQSLVDEGNLPEALRLGIDLEKDLALNCTSLRTQIETLQAEIVRLKKTEDFKISNSEKLSVEIRQLETKLNSNLIIITQLNDERENLQIQIDELEVEILAEQSEEVAKLSAATAAQQHAATAKSAYLDCADIVRDKATELSSLKSKEAHHDYAKSRAQYLEAVKYNLSLGASAGIGAEYYSVGTVTRKVNTNHIGKNLVGKKKKNKDFKNYIFLKQDELDSHYMDICRLEYEIYEFSVHEKKFYLGRKKKVQTKVLKSTRVAEELETAKLDAATSHTDFRRAEDDYLQANLEGVKSKSNLELLQMRIQKLLAEKDQLDSDLNSYQLENELIRVKLTRNAEKIAISSEDVFEKEAVIDLKQKEIEEASFSYDQQVNLLRKLRDLNKESSEHLASSCEDIKNFLNYLSAKYFEDSDSKVTLEIIRELKKEFVEKFSDVLESNELIAAQFQTICNTEQNFIEQRIETYREELLHKSDTEKSKIYLKYLSKQIDKSSENYFIKKALENIELNFQALISRVFETSNLDALVELIKNGFIELHSEEIITINDQEQTIFEHIENLKKEDLLELISNCSEFFMSNFETIFSNGCLKIILCLYELNPSLFEGLEEFIAEISPEEVMSEDLEKSASDAIFSGIHETSKVSTEKVHVECVG